jgi:hypothetical protein
MSSNFFKLKSIEVLNMECKICMEIFPNDVFQYLPCAHSLCKFCFNNLKKSECPYCKYSYSDEITEENEEYFYETLELVQEPSPRRKKHRKNKRCRNLLNSFNSSVIPSTRFHLLSLD